MAALSVTLSIDPASTPERASSGSRQTSTFSTMLLKATTPGRLEAGLRSSADPNVRRDNGPLTVPESGAIGRRLMFELSAPDTENTTPRGDQSPGIGVPLTPALSRTSMAPVDEGS